MERDDLASLAGFFAGAEPLAPGAVALLGEDAAHHARVRRLESVIACIVADGAGARASVDRASLTKQEIGGDRSTRSDPRSAPSRDSPARTDRRPRSHALVRREVR